MKITDTSLNKEITNSNLLHICSLGHDFINCFERGFIKGTLAFKQSEIKQILYILDNLTKIYKVFKKTAVYSDYLLTKECLSKADIIIKKLGSFINQIKKAKHGLCISDLNIVKASYRKIKQYAENFICINSVFTNESWPKSTVLIGALRNPNQLKLAIDYEFYHVPVSAVQNAKNIKCIAIYQSKNLFSQNPGVKYYGKVIALREIPRYEIKEIPSDSNAMYYRFEVEKWKMLKNPVTADSLGEITTETTLYQLMTAEKTSELHINSKDEYEIYNFMKNYAFTPFTGEMCLRNINILYDGKVFNVYDEGILKHKIANDSFYRNGVLSAKQISKLIKKG